jgi:hypothetical protein
MNPKNDQQEFAQHFGDLSAQERDHLPESVFGLPEKRAYPMPDLNHARLAKSMASKEFNDGKLTAEEKARIDAKADRILAEHETE